MKIQTEAELKKELSFLYQVAQSVHSLELSELLKDIVSIVVEVTQADSCLIYLFDQKHHELVLRASKNPHHSLLKNIKLKIGEGITGWVARERKPVVIESGASKDARFKYFSILPEDKFEAFLSIPIVNKKGVAGVINVQHKAVHQYSEMEINLSTAIGKLVGGAIENALLIEESLALKEALEVRKVVEKAKGILMKKKSLSEEEAFKLIQRESMNNRKSVKEIADALILAYTMSL